MLQKDSEREARAEKNNVSAPLEKSELAKTGGKIVNRLQTRGTERSLAEHGHSQP